MSTKRRPSKGKQRIEMKRIESDDARYICFAKRRMGLFAKASDLSTLCGPDIAVLVFSPGGKCYSFGSPAVHLVVDRFLSDGQHPTGSGTAGRRGNEVQKLNQEYMELTKKLEATKAKTPMIQARLRLAGQAQQCKWTENVERLGLADLRRLKESFEGLVVRANARLDELVNGQRTSSSAPVIASDALSGAGPGGEVMTPPPNVVLNVDPTNMMNPFEPISFQPNGLFDVSFGSGFL
ncbi:agamous-like MADS-box protein AGL29 [Typha latifolia]|uniref:agamous-like MADS-box protein AGL29 n=1 Tax=Typha latifolia TaxID=4733 RepID=UPI003C2D7853